MSRKMTFSPHEWYHLYNRGTEKRDIFQSEKDYDRFLRLLYLCNGSIHADLKLQGETLYDAREVPRGETLVDISAYCLMPNHFHLLIREKEAKGGISRFMQKLTTGYTMYFNKRHERNGALFQGVFKSRHVDSDRYLKYLISYIHLNPVKLIDPTWKENGIAHREAAASFLKKYRYSSYMDFAGEQRLENIVLNQTALPQYFDQPRDFESSLTEWLQGETL